MRGVHCFPHRHPSADTLHLFNRFDSMNDVFLKSFLNTLVFNIATIVAVVVGITMYANRAIRVWYANGGKEFLISTGANFAAGVNKLSERVYYTLEDAEVA